MSLEKFFFLLFFFSQLQLMKQRGERKRSSIKKTILWSLPLSGDLIDCRFFSMIEKILLHTGKADLVFSFTKPLEIQTP